MSILTRDELSIIFQYLSGVDLHNASQVCSFWLELAIKENNRRKPTWVTKKELVKCFKNWETFKTKFMDYCRRKPSLHLMFYEFKSSENLPEGCYCQYLPYNCRSITVESFYTCVIENTISNTFFPEIPNVKITTITLNNHPWDKGVYCEELKCLFDKSFSNADKLKTIFEPFTGNDIPMSSCVIFIYNFRNTEIAVNLALCLKEWFPNKKMSTLAIGMDNVSFCNTNYNSRVCQHNTDCIAILLNGTHMKSWIHELRFRSDIENEMTLLKKKATLKNHSVCFMGCTQRDYNDYGDYYEEVFQTSFPNVPLFTMRCIGSFATNKMEEFCNSIGSYEIDGYTGILFLTYD